MSNNKLKNKIYIDLFILVIIIAIFYFVIYPQYSGSGTFYSPKDNISSLLEESKGLDIALNTVNGYNNKIINTNKSYSETLNNLPVDTLDKVLPSSADPILVIYELSEIAKRPESGLLLLSPKFSDDSNDKSPNKKFNTLSVSFTVQGTYESLKAFLKNLENSNRVYNVTALSFSSSQDSRAISALDYTITVDTYYLKQN
ncbi:MAG: type 4a pilus biogenesis protein PilO [Candidatus Nomurabacteria bacterium]